MIMTRAMSVAELSILALALILSRADVTSFFASEVHAVVASRLEGRRKPRVPFEKGGENCAIGLPFPWEKS